MFLCFTLPIGLLRITWAFPTSEELLGGGAAVRVLLRHLRDSRVRVEPRPSRAESQPKPEILRLDISNRFSDPEKKKALLLTTRFRTRVGSNPVSNPVSNLVPIPKSKLNLLLHPTKNRAICFRNCFSSIQIKMVSALREELLLEIKFFK